MSSNIKVIPFNYKTVACKYTSCEQKHMCKYFHTNAEKQKQVCLFYYTTGRCRNGEECKQQHFMRSVEHPEYIVLPVGFEVDSCPYDKSGFPCKWSECPYCVDEPSIDDMEKVEQIMPRESDFPVLVNRPVTPAATYSEIAKIEPKFESKSAHIEDEAKNSAYEPTHIDEFNYKVHAKMLALVAELEEVMNIVYEAGKTRLLTKEEFEKIFYSRHGVKYAFGLE